MKKSRNDNTNINFRCVNVYDSYNEGNDTYPDPSISEKFLEIELFLSKTLHNMSIPLPVTHVYNPTEYAYSVHSKYVNMFQQSPKKIMFLGMNPGPWGMSQTGVPFGEVNIVRNWMNISGEIHKPVNENPSRPVLGFACRRNEVSGQRFWGLFKELCRDAKTFFHNAIVYNYCPVAFMTKSGKNITPNELKKEEKKHISVLCDDALRKVVALYRVSVIIAIGKFAEKRAKCALDEGIIVIYIPHPSPRNCRDFAKWKDGVIAILEEHALLNYFKS